jgi:hypothetical protein
MREWVPAPLGGIGTGVIVNGSVVPVGVPPGWISAVGEEDRVADEMGVMDAGGDAGMVRPIAQPLVRIRNRISSGDKLECDLPFMRSSLPGKETYPVQASRDLKSCIKGGTDT